MTQAVAIAQSGTNNVTMRNRIINGAMVIDQRNAGAASSNSINGYLLDRWFVAQTTTGKLIAQQNAGSVTPPTGFSNYLGVTSQSAYSVGASDFYVIGQPIEANNVTDFAWGTASAVSVTLSFKVYSSLTGTFGGVVKNYAGTRSYPFTYTVASANTWTSVSVNIAGDTSGTWVMSGTGGSIYVQFGLGVGSTYAGAAGAWASANYQSATGATSVVGTNGATFYITGVQLEAGTAATTFENRLYGTELALCQRYFQTIPGQSMNGAFYSTSQASLFYWFPVTMRVYPTATFPSLTNSIDMTGSGYKTPTSIAAYYVTPNSYGLIAGGMSGTFGNPACWTGAAIQMTSEL